MVMAGTTDATYLVEGRMDRLGAMVARALVDPKRWEGGLIIPEQKQ
jgi:hypothetical protein